MRYTRSPPTSCPLPLSHSLSRSLRNWRRNLHDDPLAASSRLVSGGTAEWSRDNIDACSDWCVAASSRAESLPELPAPRLPLSILSLPLLFSICSDLAHPARSLINRCELSIKINVRRWSEPKNKAEQAARDCERTDDCAEDQFVDQLRVEDPVDDRSWSAISRSWHCLALAVIWPLVTIGNSGIDGSIANAIATATATAIVAGNCCCCRCCCRCRCRCRSFCKYLDGINIPRPRNVNSKDASRGSIIIVRQRQQFLLCRQQGQGLPVAF